MRLAERISRTSWRLAEGWQKRLRDHGSRGDILQQIHAAVRGDPSRYDAVRPGEALPPEPGMASPVVTGRVAGKGLSDELKGTFYAVVETPAGRAYHVPLDARSAQTVGVGDLVSLATLPETAVVLWTGRSPRPPAPAEACSPSTPPRGSDAQGLARRLRDLERAGLVAAEGPARWKVPPDLFDRLAERARDAPPRYRLVVRKDPCRSRSRSSTRDRSGSIASRRRRWPTGGWAPTCSKPSSSAVRRYVASASSRTTRTGSRSCASSSAGGSGPSSPHARA